MHLREVDVGDGSKGDAGGDEELAFAAQSEIAALAHGVAPLADVAFPWPPPSYVWHRRTAEEILTFAKRRKRRRCSAHGRVLSFGSRGLDDKLSRCFALGSLVEIVGEAGTGKTQLALTLAAETVIQWYDMHAACSHPRGDFPAFSQAPDVAKEIIGDAVTLPQAQESCCQPTHASQQGMERLILSPKSSRKPAVVYYVHTEGAFPVERLHEIIFHRQQRRDKCAGIPSSRFSCKNREYFAHAVPNGSTVHTKLLLERIFTEEISSEEQLWSILTRCLPRLTVCHRVALVVLDSIAAIFRPTALEGAFAEGNCDAPAGVLTRNRKVNTMNQVKGGFIDRACKLLRVGALLRRLSAEHDFCCLIVNQVSDSCHMPFDYAANATGTGNSVDDLEEAQPAIPRIHRMKERLAPLRSRGGPCSVDGKYFWNIRSAHGPVLEDFRVQPSLGLTWGNALTSRLMLRKERARDSSFDKIGDELRTSLRCCYAVFGSDADVNENVCFEVNVAGVEDA